MAKKKKSETTTEATEVAPVVKSAVLYTDGGCLLKEGMAGWGVHGFIYNQQPELPKSFKQISATTDRGYVDAVDFEKRKAKPVTPVEYIDGWGSNNLKPTNNTAELTAAIQGMKVALEKDVQNVLILTDSEYVVKGTHEYLPKWLQQNWIKRDGQPVANQHLWKELVAHKEGLIAKGVKLELKWVRGHNGELGNETADKLATRGRSYCGQFNEYPEDQAFFSYSPSTGYWTPKSEYNRFFTHPCVYFITNHEGGDISNDGRFIYLCGRHGDDDQFGKRVADHSFSVIFLKEKSETLQLVMAAQDTITPNGYSEIVIAYTDAIFTPRVYEKLNEFKSDFMLKLSHHSNLFTPDKVQLTQVCDPPRMAFKGLEKLTVLYQQLENFLVGELSSSVVTDITHYLYEHTEVKGKQVCKLSHKVAQSTKSIKVGANYDTTGMLSTTPLTLTLGIDLPNRNALAAFADRSPKVTLLTTKESDYGFRYAVVIATDDDVGIWSSVYSNLKIKLEP